MRWIVIALLSGSAAVGGSPGGPSAERQDPPQSRAFGAPAASAEVSQDDERLEGFWPSRTLLRLALVRLADEVGERYGLDEEQQKKVRDMTVERWTEFAEDHRSALQPLINEFLEMRMGLEPPPKERVQRWAERAIPVFDEYRAEHKRAVGDFRDVLTPLQRARFEIDALRYALGMQFAERKLKQWQAGDFDPKDFWEARPGQKSGRFAERLAEGAERAAAEEAVETAQHGESDASDPAVQDQIALELLAWDKYVRKFSRIYRLDQAQRDAVRSLLHEMKQRAVAHRDARWDQIVRLEEKIANHNGREEELAEIKRLLVELYGPVDDMFVELKERIEKVPTAEQRAAASRPDDGSEEPLGDGDGAPPSPPVTDPGSGAADRRGR